MHVRKRKVAVKRLMQRCRWIVVLGLWMERIIENVSMQMSRHKSEKDRPNHVISCNSKRSCWRIRVVWEYTKRTMNYELTVCYGMSHYVGFQPPFHRLPLAQQSCSGGCRRTQCIQGWSAPHCSHEGTMSLRSQRSPRTHMCSSIHLTVKKEVWSPLWKKCVTGEIAIIKSKQIPFSGGRKLVLLVPGADLYFCYWQWQSWF